LQNQVLRLMEDPVCEICPQDGDVFGQRADADGVHRVADVEGDRDTLLGSYSPGFFGVSA